MHSASVCLGGGGVGREKRGRDNMWKNDRKKDLQANSIPLLEREEEGSERNIQQAAPPCLALPRHSKI